MIGGSLGTDASSSFSTGFRAWRREGVPQFWEPMTVAIQLGDSRASLDFERACLRFLVADRVAEELLNVVRDL
jgi:hypothetical protein